MKAKKKKPRPVQRSKNARESAYEIIQQLILGMKIKPGESVTENELSGRLGIGRTPVREALKKLEQEGLIVTVNRRKKVYLLTVKEVEEMFDIKICLESALARWAAERGNENDFIELGKTIKEMKDISDNKPSDEKEEGQWQKKWLEIDRKLHDILFSMGDNKKAEQIIRNVNTQWHRLRIGIYALEGRIEKAALEHENFVLAILDRHPEAAEQAMKVHLENLKKDLVKILRFFHYPAI